MDTFIAQLNAIYAEGTSPVDENHVFTGSEELEGIAAQKLINPGRGCNWDNIRVLRNAGFRVYAGEKDSFGWLVGCIQKRGDNRILVYG